MAGVKGKSGSKSGRSNNPTGRPIGSKNKVPNPVKQKIEEFVNGDWENLKKDIEGLEGKDKVKAKIDLIKLVVPRPVSSEEQDIFNNLVGGLSHLFGKKEEE